MEKEIIHDWLKKAGLTDSEAEQTSFFTPTAKVTVVEKEEEYASMHENIVRTASNDIFTQQLFQSLEKQGPLVAEQKPYMLHLTAFIVHEGANRNGDAFTREELAKAVAEKSLFKHGYGGIVDYNHDFSPIGYWYDAELAYDQEAGKFGVLAHGAVWAWRFPEKTKKIIEQAATTDWTIPVSMAVLSKDVVSMEEGDQVVSYLFNPIFIAATILVGMEPGDAYGRGVISDYSDEQTQNHRKQLLLVASHSHSDDNEEEKSMTKEEFETLLSKVLGDTESNVVTRVAEMVEAQVDGLNSAISEKEEALTTANQTIDELNQTIESLNARIEENGVALEAAGTEKEELNGRIAEMEGELEEFRTKAEEARIEELKAARLAEVADSVRTALEKKDDESRDRILSAWASLDEEAWEIRKSELSLVTVSENKNNRGHGVLPGTHGSDTGNSIDKFIR